MDPSQLNPNDLVHQFKETIENFKIDEEVSKMQAGAKEIADVTTDFIKKYPLQSVIAAAAAGFLVGVLVKRNKND